MKSTSLIPAGSVCPAGAVLSLACLLGLPDVTTVRADSVRLAAKSREEILQALARAHGQVASLRVDYRAWNEGEDPSAQHLRMTVAAKGSKRYKSRVHVPPGDPASDWMSLVSFFDGTWFNVYYPYYRRYEVSRRFAIRPYTDKVRLCPFFECLGWWPAGDDSEPPTVEDRPFFLKAVLVDPKCRVRPQMERLDGRWCHVVEIPGLDVLWIDVDRAALLKRERFRAGDRSKPVGLYRLMDYRETILGVWLPYSIHRQVAASPEEGVYQVDKYVVNAVPDSLFALGPPPGTLVVDRDTDESHQVPGGLEHLEHVCRRVEADMGGRLAEPPNVRAHGLRLLAALVCGAMVSAVASAWFRSWRRGR